MKRWTRYLAVILTVCLLVSTLAVTASAASLSFTDEYGTWTYELEEDGSVTILKCKTTKKNIVIPATIDGKPVKTLGKHLFQNNDTITGVVIPHGIETIEKMVFFGCNKLEHVEIPNSVKSIGDKAFSKCEVMESLYIPASVTELGDKVFEDSAKLDVRCPMSSETASYLKENKSEVANYTLIQVTAQNVVAQPETGVAPQTPAAPSKPNKPSAPSKPAVTIKGELVTYTFGKTINGKPEYTFVVADSMPDLDLMHYVIKDQNGNAYQYQGEEVKKLMANRFQLVSMSRYDGKKTETVDFTQRESWLNVGTETYNYLDEAGKNQVEVLYHLSINFMGNGSDYEFPVGLQFNSNDELLNYTLVDQAAESTMVKEGETYTYFQQVEGPSTSYQAKDGALITTVEHDNVRLHRFGVKGSCVEISIMKQDHQQANGYNFNNEHKEVVAYNPDTKTTVNSTVNLNTRPDGTKENYRSTRVEVVNDVEMDNQSVSARYDENGDLWEVHKEASSKGDEAGTYEVTRSTGKVTEQRTVDRVEHRSYGNGVEEDLKISVECEDTNRVYYEETVVRADGVQEAMKKVPQNFPNDPDEHTDDVSYRHVNTVDIHKEVGTQTNMATGEVWDIDRTTKVEVLKDYTYIGDTGKYVGWDWTWNYDYADDTAAANGDSVLTRYTVTEYKYSADNDVWTKTLTIAQANDYENGSTIDFKNTDPNVTLEQVLADYNLHSESYVYDPENSGMDNWKMTEEDHMYSFVEPDGTEKVNHYNVDKETGTGISVVTADGQQVGDPYVNNIATAESEIKGETKEQLEEMPQQQEALAAIVLGTSEVTAGDGTVLTQEETKKEMLDLAEDLQEEAFQENDYFEETITDDTIVADGEALVEKAEELLQTDKLPENNVEGSVDHHHLPDGSYETIITKGSAGGTAPDAAIAEPAAEPVAASVEEPVAETAEELAAEPVAESVEEPAAEPVAESAEEPAAEPVDEPEAESVENT